MAGPLKGRLQEAAATARRSKLHLWMEDNFDTFAAVLKRSGRPNWTELARVFGEMKLTVMDGSLPTANGAMRTWTRVKRAHKPGSSEHSPMNPRTPDAPRSPSAGFEHDPNLPEDDIRRWLDGEK